MSTTTRTILIDDLDGTSSDQEAVETVHFTLAGVSYEIDLSERNAIAMTDALAPYTQAARKVGTRTRKPRAVRAEGDADAPKAALVRVWAREHDIPLPARGRIPKAIVEQYRHAA